MEDVENADSGRITIDKFAEVDLRVARIESAEKVEKSKKLLKLKCSLGELGERQILAGIAKSFEPQELVGRHIVIVANLEPATLAGERSEGMLLATSLEDGRVQPLDPGQEALPGTRVR
jgi:methionyl-tRNA synthetase